MRKAYAGAKIADLGQTGVWDNNCQHFFKVWIHFDWRYFGLPNLISLVIHLGVHLGSFGELRRAASYSCFCHGVARFWKIEAAPDQVRPFLTNCTKSEEGVPRNLYPEALQESSWCELLNLCGELLNGPSLACRFA